MTKYKQLAGSMHTLATIPQCHFLPVSFLGSSVVTPLLGLGRSARVADEFVLDEAELVGDDRLLVTQIWMLRETHVVVPMTAQQISGRAVDHRRSVVSRRVRLSSLKVALVPRLPTMSRVKWVAGQQMACNARRRMRVERGE